MNFITPTEAAEYAKLVDADPRGPRFTERQAQAIIELQLQRLTGMEQQKILDELAEIQKRSKSISRSWAPRKFSGR